MASPTVSNDSPLVHDLSFRRTSANWYVGGLLRPSRWPGFTSCGCKIAHLANDNSRGLLYNA